ncbi:MAG: PAS domain S-box protein [Pseudomonadales bacterium]|nr:PAS domain S-box protein [Pseudomonadales bacterium]
MGNITDVSGPDSNQRSKAHGVKVRDSLAANTLRSLVFPITLVILITTIIAYVLFYASVKQRELDKLALFSKERVARELDIFKLAEDNLKVASEDLVQQLMATSSSQAEEAFGRLAVLKDNGVYRSRPQNFDTRRSPQIVIANQAKISPLMKRLILANDIVLSKYGPAWHHRFPNIYFVGKEDFGSIFWSGEVLPEVKTDFTHLDKEFYLVGTPERNPGRQPKWTSAYLSISGLHKWMVSSIAPVYLQDEFLGILGHDIFLDDLMARTINDHPDNAKNMLITTNGQLIAHPDYMDLITTNKKGVRIGRLGDDNLKTIFQLVSNRLSNVPPASGKEWRKQPVVVEDETYDRYLVATPMADMGWLMITEYPSELISRQAFHSAHLILIGGAILLLVEFFVLFLVIRQKVSKPLQRLGVAAKSWKTNTVLSIFDEYANRRDEVGALSREFMHLQETIDGQFGQLHQEIDERAQVEASLLEQSTKLNHLNANLDAMVKQRTADLEREVHERSLLTAAMEHAVESIMIVNEKMEIEYVNSMFEQQSGYRKEEVIGKTPMVLNRFKRDPAIQQEILAMMRVGKMWSGRVRTVSKDGKILEEDASVSPIKNEQGKVTHFIEVKRNITERVALEQQLQSAQKLESIGQLAAGIAHEINTPTQYIGDNTKFLKEAYDDLNGLIGKLQSLPEGEISRELIQQMLEEADVVYLQEEIPLAVDQCLEGVGRVANIVRAMKEFSHPSKEKALSDLNKAIQSTITVAANEWKYVASVETNFAENLPPVNCELGEINQVVLNIIVNAAHAIGDAKKGEKKGLIKVSTGCDSGWVEIRIADNGAGMPDAIREKIFDPFFTTKEVGKGTGQGLSIAHKVIVKNHGGIINVESIEGQGTEFIIRLPLDTVATDTAGTDQKISASGLC